MPQLHDPNVREAVQSRIRTIQPDARGKRGEMTVASACLHHLAQCGAQGLGNSTVERIESPEKTMP